jgi:hypothetical protein
VRLALYIIDLVQTKVRQHFLNFFNRPSNFYVGRLSMINVFALFARIRSWPPAKYVSVTQKWAVFWSNPANPRTWLSVSAKLMHGVFFFSVPLTLNDARPNNLYFRHFLQPWDCFVDWIGRRVTITQRKNAQNLAPNLTYFKQGYKTSTRPQIFRREAANLCKSGEPV